MKHKSLLPAIHFLLFLLFYSCQAQGPVNISLTIQPNSKLHYHVVEEKIDRSESRGLEDFHDGEYPNPANWTTTITTEKDIQTSNTITDGSFSIRVNHRRTQEIRGKGIYKEGIYSDSVLVFGKGGLQQTVIFDSVALRPKNDAMTRESRFQKINDVLADYAQTAAIYSISEKKINVGDSFMVVHTLPGVKGAILLDTMTYTLKSVKDNIATLSFIKQYHYTSASSHINNSITLKRNGEIKIDLARNIMLQRNQEDHMLSIEKWIKVNGELESETTRKITETYIE